MEKPIKPGRVTALACILMLLVIVFVVALYKLQIVDGKAYYEENRNSVASSQTVEAARGSGFAYAYQFPGMNKVLQAAGRVIRTPRDKGVVLLIDNRFAMPDYRRLMPPHWSHLKMIYDTEKLERELWRFWEE